MVSGGYICSPPLWRGKGEGPFFSVFTLQLPVINYPAAKATCLGTYVYYPVGGTHDVLVVLHHHHGIAKVAELVQDLYEPFRVARVQAYGRFVQNVKAAHQSRTERSGQVDALALAARQGVGQTVEGKVRQAYVHQELEPGPYLHQQTHGYLLFVLREA